MEEAKSTSQATSANTEALVRAIRKQHEKQAAEKKESENAFANVDVGVVREGTQITLPEAMTNEEAILCLKRKIEEDETIVAIHEEVVAHPIDGSYALMQVLRKIYGWAHAAPTPGFFGPRPPVMVNFEVGFNKSVQVIWGGFTIPGVEGQLQTSYTLKNGQVVFSISGKVKQKYQSQVKSIADEVRRHVREKSAYKGQAIRLRTDEDGQINFDFEYAPQFMDLSQVREEELIFSEEVARLVQTSVFTIIEQTDLCRKLGIPLRRGILFEGKFGVGKTLTANVTAKKCTENGWTFIYLDRVTGLKDAVLFARNYSPAVIFAEDIDRLVTGERTVKIDDVLNNVDGVDSKNQELMVILTTNKVEAIEPAMIRPGRLDAVISISPPDASAVERLIRLYTRGRLAEGQNIAEVSQELAGQIPAVIREVVERAKLEAVQRMIDTGASEADLSLTAQDLMLAARSMRSHLALMAPPVRAESTIEQQLGSAVIAGFIEALTQGRGTQLDFVEKASKAIAARFSIDV